MSNLINWFEIPAKNLKRAVTFYKAILDLDIEETEMFGTKMGFFPNDGHHVSGAIVEGEGYKPSTDGALVYLNGGDDLQLVLNRVNDNQGNVIVSKTQISPEIGYFGMFIDTEGNKMAIHSMH